jgi:hypothetical protein
MARERAMQCRSAAVAEWQGLASEAAILEDRRASDGERFTLVDNTLEAGQRKSWLRIGITSSGSQPLRNGG